MKPIKVKVDSRNKENELVIFKCTICSCDFSEQEGGLKEGAIGMIEVSFCPSCFSGLLDMLDYFRG
tara:strand:- start:776 stop:973 length:198 start_codon:yes stop_codon:yes gene_type:complete